MPALFLFERQIGGCLSNCRGRRVVAPLRSYCFLCVGNGQCPFRNPQQIPRREQAPALPHKIIPTNPILSLKQKQGGHFYPSCFYLQNKWLPIVTITGLDRIH